MVDGKDDVIKRHQIVSRISAEWFVAEQNTIFYHWLYRWGVLELVLTNQNEFVRPIDKWMLFPKIIKTKDISLSQLSWQQKQVYVYNERFRSSIIFS